MDCHLFILKKQHSKVTHMIKLFALAQVIQHKMEEKYPNWASALPDEEPWEKKKMPPPKKFVLPKFSKLYEMGFNFIYVDDLFDRHCKNTNGERRCITSAQEPVILCLVSFLAGVWLLFNSLCMGLCSLSLCVMSYGMSNRVSVDIERHQAAVVTFLSTYNIMVIEFNVLTASFLIVLKIIKMVGCVSEENSYQWLP